MATYPPRPPVPSASPGGARNPFVAGLLGGLVVLVVGALLVAAGVIGKDEKTTIVQSAGRRARSPSTDEGQGAGLTVNEIYKRDGPGVVFIRAEVIQQTDRRSASPQEQRGEATGSGFVIDKDGHILTNAHVVEGASKIEVGFGDDKTVDAKRRRPRREHRRRAAEGRRRRRRPQAARRSATARRSRSATRSSRSATRSASTGRSRPAS